MEMISLPVQARKKEIAPKQLRREEIVPCVVYGNDTENTSIQCDHKSLMKTFVKAGESTLVELEIDGKKVPVLFHAITFHPVTDKITHVDFYAVNMKKEIEAHVPINMIGEAPAVKDLGGVLITSLDHLTVKCLPTNLPHALEVDISSLTEFGITITVADVVIPENVTVSEEPEQVIASVHEPRRAEEEVIAEETEGEEGAEGEKEEGEESEEGDEKGEGGDDKKDS